MAKFLVNRSLYLIEFKTENDLIQLINTIKNKKWLKYVELEIIKINELYKIVFKAPYFIEVYFPLIEEFGLVRKLSKQEKAYYEEYGKIIGL